MEREGGGKEGIERINEGRLEERRERKRDRMSEGRNEVEA